MSDKSSESELPEPNWTKRIVCSMLGVIVVFSLLAGIQFWIVRSLHSTSDIASTPHAESDSGGIQKFGISGDFFGFTNACFSALAFAGIIVTLLMQKYELKQQREELKDTRKVMSQQQKEMEEQNRSLRRQRFENTFFGMLELHGTVVNAIMFGNGGATGRAAFSELLNDLKRSIQSSPRTGHVPTRAIHDEQISVTDYEQWYLTHEGQLGHYFRTLYNIIRYVDEHGGEQPEVYTRLVRAQLSSNELTLLFYNGLSEFGRDRFKPLIEKYALLKHLRHDSYGEHLKSEYATFAYGATG